MTGVQTCALPICFLIDNGLPVDLADGPDQAFLVPRRVIGAVESLQLFVQIGKLRLETPTEPMQDGEVGLVDAVHVAGNGDRHDIRRVAAIPSQ